MAEVGDDVATREAGDEMGAMAADKSPHGGEIIVEVRGAAGIVTLNRPLARNALSIPMRAALADAFPRFARDPIVYAVVIRSAVPGAFSVGGDVAEITRLGRSDPATARKGLADELRLSWRHECFTKPTASLIDGPVMGTGVGISLYGTHRIAGEGYRFAMPEVRIGYFPDCGVMHAFARMPRHIGRYLALTGRTIDRADAYFLKLATHTIDSRHFPDIEASLAAADPIDPVLDTRHRDPGPSRIAEEAGRIESMFSGRRIADIVAALEAVGGDGRACSAISGAPRRLRSRSRMPTCAGPARSTSGRRSRWTTAWPAASSRPMISTRACVHS
jgi:enoyl-CoA hydratase